MNSVPEMTPRRSERNLGIELMRIVSMMLICLLHILGRGGIYPNTEKLSVNYKIAWYLETLGYCSVNCYALISGYANVKSKFRFRKIFYLWAEVLFITVSSTVICYFIPSITVTNHEWLMAFTPFFNREYWYFCAYFFLFPFIPILNGGIQSLTKKQHLTVMGFLFAITTLFPIISKKDHFSLGGGYTCIWLMVLYIFGAYFRLYGIPKSAKWYVTLPAFFGLGAVAWGKKIIVETLLRDGKIEAGSYIAQHSDSLISYTSPCMVLMAIALMMFFGQITVKRDFSKKIISALGKSTFGVFLVHVGSMGWYHFLGGRYKKVAGYQWYKMTAAIIAIDVVFYLGCSLYSLARVYIFKVLKVHEGVDKIADLLDAKITRKKSEKQ